MSMAPSFIISPDQFCCPPVKYFLETHLHRAAPSTPCSVNTPVLYSQRRLIFQRAALWYSEIQDTSLLCLTSFPALLTPENHSSLLITALQPCAGFGTILTRILKRSFPKAQKFCPPELLGCPCCPRSPSGFDPVP